MSFIYPVLSFVALILISFYLENFLTPKYKRFAFISSISIIGLVLYFLTFIMPFYIGQYLIYGLAFIIFIKDFLQSKLEKLKTFIFNEHRQFLLLSLVFAGFSIFAQILQWDDYSWGAFVKHLNRFGHYWNSDSAILEQGLRYFPGASLWESFFLGKNLFFEQPLFFSLALIFTATIHGIMPQNLDRKKWFYHFVLICAPISWFSIGIFTINLEVPMGLLLGMGLISIIDLEEPRELIVPFSIALFLAITKETGLVLSLLIVFAIILRVMRKKLFFSRWTLFSILCLLIMFINFELWQWYLKQDPILKTFPTADIANQIKSDLQGASARTIETLHTFFDALFTRPLGRCFLSRIPLPYFKYIKGFYFFWAGLFTICFYLARKEFEFIITFLWGLFGYSFLLLITFLYVFGEYEGRLLASYERYIGMYFLASALLAIKLSLDKGFFQKRLFLKFVVTLIVLFIPSPRIFYPDSIKYLLPNVVREKLRIHPNAKEEIEIIRSKVITQTSENSKIWFIWQHSQGLEAMAMRFEIAPRKMNVSKWSFGKPYGPEDIWTHQDNIEGVESTFLSVDYVAIGYLEDSFIENFSTLFKEKPKSGSLYKKHFINNKLQLVEVL